MPSPILATPIFPARALALLAILLGAAAARAAPLPPAPAGDIAPDARTGEALYVGTLRLEHGGAPCLACHGIAGHGLARAASFGPDLTAAHASYGGAELEAALEEMPFPSMRPIYAIRPLTGAERRHLGAFLAESARREPARLGPSFAAGVAVAAAVFLLLFWALGRRRTARRPSRHPARGAMP